MRRAVVYAAAVTVILVGWVTGPPSEANARQDVSTAGQEQTARPIGWRQEQCRFATRDGRRGVSPKEARAMLRCAEHHWSGNLALGMAIVACESGFNALADNPSSSAAGLWQSLDSTWESWYAGHPHLVERWHLKNDPKNGRASAVLGWHAFRPANTGPWEASRSCWG